MFTLNDPRIPTTYDEAVRLLDEQGVCVTGDDWKVAHNTHLVRYADSIAVRLHNTEVVTYHPDGTFMLDTGGWNTVTTRQRINLFTPVGVRVWQHDHDLYVADQYGEREFEDGICVKPAARSPFVDA